MPPYSWIHLERVFWLFGGGALIACAIILARASGYLSFSFAKKSDEELKRDEHDFAGLFKERNGPVPIFIWLLIVGYLAWAVGYVFFAGVGGL